MKFSSAASVFLAATHGACAFVSPPAPTSTARSASAALSAAADPYASVVDAISSAADAASEAARQSSQLAASIPHAAGDVRFDAHAIVTPESVAAAQAKLSVLEHNLAVSSDPAAMSKAVVDALDATVRAAEHAAGSASVLTANLADFDAALATSVAKAPAFHLLTPEAAEVAQAKLALLVHNLSGASVDDAFLNGFLADVDRRLEGLAAGTGTSASTALMYSAAAFVLAYSQRQAGVNGYKEELKKKLADGKLDIKMLAEDVGVPSEAMTEAIMAEKPLEDPAIAMAAALTESPPYIAAAVAVEEVSAPQPPAEEIPLSTLMEAAAAENIVKDVQEASAVQPEPEPVLAMEASKPKEADAKAVVKKTKKKKKAGRAASPLARLLAEEHGLDLTAVGRGSGKEGRILIDDVRKFVAQMEKAKNSLTNGVAGAYFATAST